MNTAQILNAVISIASLALTSLVIPLLSAKLGTEKVKQDTAKFNAWVAMAEKVVAAAKQKADLVTNAQMKDFAVQTLTALGVPKTALETVIESAVKALKAADELTENALNTASQLGTAAAAGMESVSSQVDIPTAQTDNTAPTATPVTSSVDSASTTPINAVPAETDTPTAPPSSNIADATAAVVSALSDFMKAIKNG